LFRLPRLASARTIKRSENTHTHNQEDQTKKQNKKVASMINKTKRSLLSRNTVQEVVTKSSGTEQNTTNNNGGPKLSKLCQFFKH
jgi:hypothetical protein